jgi:hypothetical protein
VLADFVVQLLQLQQVDVSFMVAVGAQHRHSRTLRHHSSALASISQCPLVISQPTYLYVMLGRVRYLRGAAGALTALHSAAVDRVHVRDLLGRCSIDAAVVLSANVKDTIS